MKLEVDTAAKRIHFNGACFDCVLGREGAVASVDKREGDGRTPLGTWPIRGALLRPESDFAPPAYLPWRWIRRLDGWCDDPLAPDYNRPVQHPSSASAERLWRDDHVYDVVVVLGYNDSPPLPRLGSAIFLHLSNGYPTEGCIAVENTAMCYFLKTIPAVATIVVC